jgi:hypothetical protein
VVLKFLAMMVSVSQEATSFGIQAMGGGQSEGGGGKVIVGVKVTRDSSKPDPSKEIVLKRITPPGN